MDGKKSTCGGGKGHTPGKGLHAKNGHVPKTHHMIMSKVQHRTGTKKVFHKKKAMTKGEVKLKEKKLEADKGQHKFDQVEKEEEEGPSRRSEEDQ